MHDVLPGFFEMPWCIVASLSSIAMGVGIVVLMNNKGAKEERRRIEMTVYAIGLLTLFFWCMCARSHVYIIHSWS